MASAGVGEPVEERGGHLGIAEDGGPFAEGEVGGDDDRGLLVEPADEMEEQLAAGLGEGQVAEFVEHDQVHAAEMIGEAALAAGAGLGLELVDEIDDVEEAAAGAAADAGAGDADGKMGLAGAGPADQHEVALLGEEAPAETITAFIPEACSCCDGGLALTEAEQRAVTERIAAQNDRFRTTLGTALDVPGQLVVTSGVMAKGAGFLAAAGAAVQAFATFTEDNDPHGEHDFGAVTVEGVAVWWKIDLYDAAYAYGSERRDDLTATRRVLTLLLPEDY